MVVVKWPPPYDGGMGMDDANDTRGEPGACPDHEWKVGEILLTLSGAQLTVVCRWCGALQVEPSQNEGFYEDTSEADAQLMRAVELTERLHAEGGAPPGVVGEVREILPPDVPGSE